MNIKNIIRLAQVMAEHGLTELEVHDKDESIRLCANSKAVQGGATAVAPSTVEIKEPAPPCVEDCFECPGGSHYITAPMPGTFFAAASPDVSAYVSEGSSVQENSVVCIIEAMKVMNEVKAECSGTIVKVLVANGDPVEYGQNLFEVK